jgi:hypothetical protein
MYSYSRWADTFGDQVSKIRERHTGRVTLLYNAEIEAIPGMGGGCFPPFFGGVFPLSLPANATPPAPRTQLSGISGCGERPAQSFARGEDGATGLVARRPLFLSWRRPPLRHDRERVRPARLVVERRSRSHKSPQMVGIGRGLKLTRPAAAVAFVPTNRSGHP